MGTLGDRFTMGDDDGRYVPVLWDTETSKLMPLSENGVVSQETLSPTGLSAPMRAPGGWGEAWRSALAEADSRLVRIKGVGDSITTGHSAGTVGNSYFGRTVAAMQELYGDGGTGLINGAHLPQFSLPGLEAQATVEENGAAIFTVAYGYGSGGLLVAGGTQPTITFPNIRGRHLRLRHEMYVGAAGYDVLINGVVVATVNTNGAAAIGSYDVDVTAEDGYTVQLRGKGAGGFTFYALDAYNDTGVVGHNMSMGGQSAPNAIAQGAFTDDSSGIGGLLNLLAEPCDLCIVSLGVNDYSLSVTPSSFKTSYNNVAQAVRFTGSNPSYVFVVFTNSEATENDKGNVYYDHVAAQVTVADTFDGALLNLYARWPRLDAQKLTSGHYTSGDTVHPNQAGHEAVSDVLIDLLTLPF